jgi:hypothetical protein
MEIVTVSQLQEKFNQVYKTSLNPHFVLDNEIKEIVNYVNTVPSMSFYRSLKHKSTDNYKSTATFSFKIPDKNLFNTAFYQVQNNGSFEVERSHIDNDLMYEIKLQTVKQAKEFFEYYKWLNELQAAPKKVEKKPALTHKQKLLALHYLGLDTSKYENSKTAKILSEILELSEDNTRQYLSYLSAGKNDVRTKSNLEKVLQLFDKQGLTDISNKLKTDIEKM